MIAVVWLCARCRYTGKAHMLKPCQQTASLMHTQHVVNPCSAASATKNRKFTCNLVTMGPMRKPKSACSKIQRQAIQDSQRSSWDLCSVCEEVPDLARDIDREFIEGVIDGLLVFDLNRPGLQIEGHALEDPLPLPLPCSPAGQRLRGMICQTACQTLVE